VGAVGMVVGAVGATGLGGRGVGINSMVPGIAGRI